MITMEHCTMGRSLRTLFAGVALCALAVPAGAGEYAALKGVEGLDTVFDVSQGNPKAANTVFWAVENVGLDEAVRALPNPPRTVVVFRGPAVKLLSSDREGFEPGDRAALDRFADTIRRMKKEGVTFEVCLYAAKVLDIDPATLMPEIDPVGNGFIAISGYQAQGYSVIHIP